MSKLESRTVYFRLYGIWVNKKLNGKKATSLHATQSEAIDTAMNFLKKQGGGELIVKNRNGQIRSRTTVLPDSISVASIK